MGNPVENEGFCEKWFLCKKGVRIAGVLTKMAKVKNTKIEGCHFVTQRGWSFNGSGPSWSIGNFLEAERVKKRQFLGADYPRSLFENTKKSNTLSSDRLKLQISLKHGLKNMLFVKTTQKWPFAKMVKL